VSARPPGRAQVPPQVEPQAIPPAPVGGVSEAVVQAAEESRNGHAGILPEVASPLTDASGPSSSTTSCTVAQLRRFIKSRAYVPMHELRRRFGINGQEDDVTPVPMSSGTIYVGLPRMEGMLLGELLRGGEVGFELSLDPRSPIVVGVYPMRPVPRP
jgi:hypothetical protein